MISVTKIVKFDAAHFLPGYKGKCANMHGHTWVIEIEVARPDNYYDEETGMVLDFSFFKDALQGNYLEKLDHKVLNEVPNLQNPTAEVICEWTRNTMINAFGFGRTGVEVIRVRVWESDSSYAEWRCDED